MLLWIMFKFFWCFSQRFWSTLKKILKLLLLLVCAWYTQESSEQNHHHIEPSASVCSSHFLPCQESTHKKLKVLGISVLLCSSCLSYYPFSDVSVSESSGEMPDSLRRRVKHSLKHKLHYAVTKYTNIQTFWTHLLQRFTAITKGWNTFICN